MSRFRVTFYAAECKSTPSRMRRVWLRVVPFLCSGSRLIGRLYYSFRPLNTQHTQTANANFSDEKMEKNTMILTVHNCVECTTSQWFVLCRRPVQILVIFFCSNSLCFSLVAIFMLAHIWCGQPHNYYYYLCTHNVIFGSTPRWVDGNRTERTECLRAQSIIITELLNYVNSITACVCNKICVAFDWSQITNNAVVG